MALQQDTIDKIAPRAPADSTARARVLNRLSNEHRYLTALLGVLDTQTKALAPGGTPDYHTLRDIVDYLSNFPDQHHHPLEDAVYEKLRENYHASTSMVAELLAEHDDMAAVTQSLKQKLDAMCAGSQNVKRPVLQANLEEYLQLYHRHISMEEGETFPLAKEHLSESDWQEIERTMRAPEDPVFGAGVTRRYRKVVDALDAAGEELAEDIAIIEWLGMQTILDSGAVLVDGASQVFDVVKHHTRRSWQEAFELIKTAQQADAKHSNLDLPRLIIGNNLKRCGKCLRHSRKIQQSVTDSIRETWSWQRNALGSLLRPDKSEDTH